MLALQTEALAEIPPSPLDVLGAETEGMIGYLLARELRARIPSREVATILTQVEVDPNDPAFATPTKSIGPVYDEAQVEQLATRRGWTLEREAKGGFRRRVPSPEPRAILEIEVIRLLVAARVLVICAGGGGIPVARTAEGTWRGVEAVVDKDLASASLATSLDVDFLLLLTDQSAVYADWPEPAREPIRETTVEALRALPFEPGTMAPKVEAACRFVEATGKQAAIGALRDARAIVEGEAGTRVSGFERARRQPESGRSVGPSR